MKKRYAEPGGPSVGAYFAGGTVIFGLALISGYLFSSDAIGITVAIVGFAGLRDMLRGIYRWRFERRQSERDNFAASLIDNKRKDFFLYLRPFNSTGRLPITLQTTTRYDNTPGYSPKVHYEDNHIDLETELARALEPWGQLVGLGSPGTAKGAGRIAVSDEEWRTRVLDLS